MKIYQCDMCKHNFTFKLPGKLVNDVTDSKRMERIDLCAGCLEEVLKTILAKSELKPVMTSAENLSSSE